ncbi:MAG: methylmalonyl-CoA epimerase [Calditrichaeota bacterium]|nr:methylmalonyl-CoA epimerase [Calditrichota bacterium]MCB9368295.1 methylmalonyl-CoA epimerase [Calditrichota bacterium]
MIDALDHIAIAVPNIDDAIQNWQRKTGAQVTHREHVAAQGVYVAFLALADFRIELIAPDSDSSSVAKFLEKRGPGLHHIAIKSQNGQELLDELANKDTKLINSTLRPGAENTMVGFAHPSAFDGVLVEIVEHPGAKGE